MSTLNKPEENAATEPILNRGVAVVAATLIINLIVALGVPVTDDLKVYLIGIISLLAPAVLAFLARAKAWSPDSVRKLVDEIEASVVSRNSQGGAYSSPYSTGTAGFSSSPGFPDDGKTDQINTNPGSTT